ncbi:molybdopterin cofactor-binding domain-containing protein [Desulfocicer niacini]
MAQVAAEVLGIDIKDISVSETDTDMTPFDCGTHGSRLSEEVSWALDSL